MKLSIIIPAKNEEQGLALVLPELTRLYPDAEVIVVDDGGGLTSRNYKELPYKHVRRPVFPLDMD